MKKVLVVGGGASGMMAAGTAAQKGHIVHLYEKNESVRNTNRQMALQ